MRIKWIWLACVKGVSLREKLSLVEHFGDADTVYELDAQALSDTGLLGAEAVQALGEKSLNAAQQIVDSCARKSVNILTFADSAFPNRLKNIPDPPLVLYYTGTLPDFDANAVIGVVGTRKASSYGLASARKLALEICSCGGMVVSGMAAGIDSAAAEGALQSNSPVVGVLGCGIDKVYPASAHTLYRRVRGQGCLISEYPPGTPGAPWTFPARNRIISGLSCGVLIVEAPEKSGALITARQALEQGRDVFVVPGNIGVSSCAGSNALLRDGAIMAGSGWDVVGEYSGIFPGKLDKAGVRPAPAAVAQTAVLPSTDKKSVDNPASSSYSGVDPTLSPDEQALVAALSKGEMHTDELMACVDIPSHKAMSALTMLKIKGTVTVLPGSRVKLNN